MNRVEVKHPRDRFTLRVEHAGDGRRSIDSFSEAKIDLTLNRLVPIGTDRAVVTHSVWNRDEDGDMVKNVSTLRFSQAVSAREIANLYARIADVLEEAEAEK